MTFFCFKAEQHIVWLWLFSKYLISVLLNIFWELIRLRAIFNCDFGRSDTCLPTVVHLLLCTYLLHISQKGKEGYKQSYVLLIGLWSRRYSLDCSWKCIITESDILPFTFANSLLLHQHSQDNVIWMNYILKCL